MKKPLFLFFACLLVLSLSYINLSTDHPADNRILTANLTAALELDRKFVSTCGEVTFDYREGKTKAPLLDGLGTHTFAISSSSKESQTYFNQGLNLTYAFNHTEAHRSFRQASELSSDAPMTYWGQAYALSPNINDYVLDDQRKQNAHESLTKAMNLLENGNALEQSLIKALRKRFVQQGDSIIVDNNAYMNAMKAVVGDFPENADVLTLYVASIMNTMPWNYWTKDLKPRPNTLNARDALNKALSLDPQHAGAHHYNIHLMELPFPDEAAKSGDALAPLMPGAGHIVHMPSHAYIRVGRYKDAAEANLMAIEADEEYISQCYAQGNYPLGYYPHNIHFLWSAATQMGDSKTAILAAKKAAEKTSMALADQVVFIQTFAAVPLQAYVRFGKWNEILTIPYPGGDLKHLKLYWHYARGLAFTRKGIFHEAQEELDSIQRIVSDESYESLYVGLNSSGHVARIAFHIVKGELSAAQKQIQKAEKHYKMAIVSEDSLTYNEPQDWHLSTRLNYGHFLNDQQRYKDAVIVFEEDLEDLRENGWALIGLYNAYRGLEDEARASQTMSRFQDSWKYADIEISSSVF